MGRLPNQAAMHTLAGRFLIVTARVLLAASSQQFRNLYGALDRERLVVSKPTPDCALPVRNGMYQWGVFSHGPGTQPRLPKSLTK